MNRLIVRTSFIFSVLGALAIPISIFLSHPYVFIFISILSPHIRLILWPSFNLLFAIGITGIFNSGLVGLLLLLLTFLYAIACNIFWYAGWGVFFSSLWVLFKGDKKQNHRRQRKSFVGWFTALRSDPHLSSVATFGFIGLLIACGYIIDYWIFKGDRLHVIYLWPSSLYTFSFSEIRESFIGDAGLNRIINVFFNVIIYMGMGSVFWGIKPFSKKLLKQLKKIVWG